MNTASLDMDKIVCSVHYNFTYLSFVKFPLF